MKHHHAVFALENDLIAGSPMLHWSPHARLGVDLGSSSSHARNTYLILNLHMGWSHRSITAVWTTSLRRWDMAVLMSVFHWHDNNCLGSLPWSRHLPWNTTMKFHSLLNACSLEMIQLHVLKNLTTPSLLVTSPAHPLFLISLCRISTTSVCHNSQWGSQLPLQSSHDSSDLQDTSSSARTSLQGRVCKMSGLWQNQCHTRFLQ